MVCSFLPVCGHCRWCSTGQSNLCDLGATILDGCLPDGTFRFHEDGKDIGGMCMLGTFSERAVISENSAVKVDDDLPLDKVVLIGCGVPTGWGSAVYAAATEPGDTIAIYGIGGIGINAVQGAALAGARNMVADRPAGQQARGGRAARRHAQRARPPSEAHELIQELTRGVGADKAIITVGVVNAEVVTQRVQRDPQGRHGGDHRPRRPDEAHRPALRRDPDAVREAVKGSLFGSGDPFHDIPRMVGLYQAGDLKLDELITTTYTLDQINQGYQDLLDGKNIRGVIRYALSGLTCPAGSRLVTAHAGAGPAAGRRPAPRARGARRRAGGRPPRRARGPAGHRASRRCCATIAADAGQAVVFVEGNAELTPGPAGRPARPGAGAGRGLRAGQLHRRAAADGDARRRACSTSRSSTGSPRRRSTS